MVSGAVFTDLNADGWPELVLACEWGPIRILRNDKGTFSLWDPPVTQVPRTKGLSTPSHLSALTGWWNSVAVGDFDNDGRLDLVIGNWGVITHDRLSWTNRLKFILATPMAQEI